MKRLTALPRIRRDPAALKLAIRRKRDRHQNAAVEERQLVLAVAAQIRRELKS